jgi:S1-C subfamily serine protease
MEVLSVQEQSPAARAGLRAADSILQINGKAPGGFIDFNRELLAAKDKKPVTLLIQRERERRTIDVRMVPENSFFNAELVRKKVGASVQDLTPELSRQFAFGNLEGVLVAGVDRGSAAAAAELDSGMLITSIDAQATSTIVGAAKVLYGKKKGDHAKLEVIFPRRRGPFIEYRPAIVDLRVQ